MSGTFTFTDAQKADIRRFTGYGSIGSGNTNFEAWRFFQTWGFMEFRMNNSSDEEGAVVVTYLGNLNTLEAAIYTSGANLDTDSAAVWFHNKKEVRDRKRLYDLCRRELCAFYGLPPGPGLSQAGTLTAIV